MADPRPSPTIYPSLDAIQSSKGPAVAKYAIVPNGSPGLYRWALGSIATEDDWTTLAASGGYGGTWNLMGFPDKGANLADGNATIQVGGKQWRVLPAATLTGNATLTLGTTNAREGYMVEITRLDVGAYTYAIANGGPAAGTLATMPISQRARLVAYFDGTNWLHRCSHLML